MDDEVDVPEVGSVWNYGGDNYVVTRVEENRFICQDDGDWVDAIEITDKVNEGEEAKVTYVLSLDNFIDCYSEGEIVEGASAEQLPVEEGPEVDNTLPNEGEEAEAKD